MKRPTIILIVDSLSFIGFVLLSSTGVLLHYILPPGSGRWATIWGLNRHEWGDIHFFIAVVFFLVLTVHLFLHWRAILNLVKGSRETTSRLRLGLGLTGLIVLLLFALAPFISPENIEEKTHGPTRQHRGSSP